MYIEPNSICHLLYDVPLDPTYEHTLWFDLDTSGKRKQTNYFKSKTKYTLTKQTYTRHTDGVMIVELTADKIYDCNYLMFQNTSYGNRWFYAFITNVEYVNDSTSYVYFQIDVLQTWHFDYTPKQCFVEREHSLTDEIGDNLLPEDLEYGEYITLNSKHLSKRESGKFQLGVAVYVTAPPTDDEELAALFKYPDTVGNIPRLCYMYTDTIDGFQTAYNLRKLARYYSGEPSGAKIVAMFVYPKEYAPYDDAADPNINFIRLYDESTYALCSNRADGTPPKNNKLRTHPYCCYTVQTPSGATELKYELSARPDQVQYVINSQVSPTASAIGYPAWYGGVRYCYDKAITLNGYPQIAWVNESYQEWLAQNGSRLAECIETSDRNLRTDLGNILFGTPLGSGSNIQKFVSAGIGAINSLRNAVNTQKEVVATYKDHYATPDTLQGSIAGCDNLIYTGEADFYFYAKSILPQFVTIIDDYFTKFGYATHLTKTPNRNSRPHFNYVKTLNATITGSVPADDMRVICSIYDNGITFWKNANEVGDYTVDNRP